MLSIWYLYNPYRKSQWSVESNVPIQIITLSGHGDYSAYLPSTGVNTIYGLLALSVVFYRDWYDLFCLAKVPLAKSASKVVLVPWRKRR